MDCIAIGVYTRLCIPPINSMWFAFVVGHGAGNHSSPKDQKDQQYWSLGLECSALTLVESPRSAAVTINSIYIPSTTSWTSCIPRLGRVSPLRRYLPHLAPCTARHRLKMRYV